MVRDKLINVRERIHNTAVRAGRGASDIVLVCVTKEATLKDACDAVDAGATDIGENRIQDAVAKYDKLNNRAPIRWHFIGHLQTNKVKKAVRIFDLIHSVDSVRLLEEIQKQSKSLGKMQSVLIEVNVSGEKSKYGAAPETLEELIKAASGMKNVMLLGLMAMAPYSPRPEDSRTHFRRLRELRDEYLSLKCDNIDLKHLSMGMSGDFEVAIEEGADIVRIGSAIFK